MNDKIYTHDKAAEIIELFEDLLTEHNIKIPSPEDYEREEDNDAPIYGTTYGDLLEDVEDILIDMLNAVDTESYIPGKFSGTF